MWHAQRQGSSGLFHERMVQGICTSRMDLRQMRRGYVQFESRENTRDPEHCPWDSSMDD